MRKLCMLYIVLGVLLLAVPAAMAEATVIQPVSTTLEPNNDSYLQYEPRWIDGSGLIDASIVETGDVVPAVWPEHISGYNNTRTERIRNADEFETLTFDLGGAFELSGMVLWNSTEANQTERGFEHTALSYSTDGGVTFVSGETLTWTERNGVDEVAGNQGTTEPVDGWITFAPEVQMLTASVPGVTHVRMLVDNFSDAGANGITLASEIRFIEGTLAGPVAIYPIEVVDQQTPNTFNWTFEGDAAVIDYTFTLSTDPNFAKPGALLVDSAPVSPVEGPGVNPLGLQSDPNGFYTYSGTLANNTPYWWRVDTIVYEPNEANRLPIPEPNIVYDIPASIQGPTWDFVGPITVPIITQQPIDVRAFETDADVVYTCQFSSALAPTVLWYQVGNPTPLSTGGDIVISTVNDGGEDYTSTLQILTPALADEGEYYCTIDNGTPLLLSDVAYLIINQLLAQYDFDGTLAPAAGSLADAPTGQGMTTDGLAEPNEVASSPTAVSYVTGVDGVGLAVSIDPNDFVNFSTDGYPRAGSLTGGIGRGLDTGTIVYWVKPVSNGSVYGTFNDGTLTGVSSSLAGTNPTQGRIYVRGVNAAGTGNVVLANNITGMPDRPAWDIFDGQWHMIASTWEAGDNVRVYVDGQPVVTGNAGNPAQYMPWNRNVLLGASRKSADRNILVSMFGGAVDNLRIYNYRLDADALDVFAQEYYDNTGILPCLDSNFPGNEYNFDNTGSSYCVVDLADFVELAAKWLNSGLWETP